MCKQTNTTLRPYCIQSVAHIRIIRWYNQLRHTITENMATKGNFDNPDLMMILRWVTNISSRSPKREWFGCTHITLYIAMNIKKVIKKTNNILDTLLKEHIQEAFTHASISFTICVQRTWVILYDDNNGEGVTCWNQNATLSKYH